MKKNSGRKTKEQMTKTENADKNLSSVSPESPKSESNDITVSKGSVESKSTPDTAYNNAQSSVKQVASAKKQSSGQADSPVMKPPSVDKESSTIKKPSTSEKLSVKEQSSATQASSAKEDPTANEVPSANEKSSVKKELSSGDKPLAKAEPATNKAAEVKPKPKAKSNGPSSPSQPQAQVVEQNNSNVIAIIAIILVFVLGAGGYYFYQQLNSQLLANSNSVTKLLTSQSQERDKTRAAINEQLNSAEQQVQALSTQVSVSDKNVALLQDKLLDLSGRRPNDWLLAEANYLVRLAGRKLWLEKDQQTASSLLATADLRIAEMNDPSLLALRKALAKDIAALQALPTDQTESIALRIDGLISQVDNLKLNNIKVPQALANDDGSLSKSPADWKENIAKTWDSFLEGFVTVRRRSGTIEPLMSPKQQWYLEENLKGKLVQSQLALYRQQQDAFEHSIELATRWVMQFYDRSDSTTEFMLKEFAQLQQLKISVKYPQKFNTSDLLYLELSRRSIAAPTNKRG